MQRLLTPADFEALEAPLVLNAKVGERDLAIELRVESVTTRPSHRLRAQPFSLCLKGPGKPLLPQGMYPLQHPKLGEIALFIVPSGADGASTDYEVTFN